MAERIFTLFGEEIVPDPPKPAPKSRVRKKDDEKKPDDGEQETETQAEAVTEQLPAVEKAADTEEKKFELPEDWKGDKKYYTIGEVAALFKVKTSHIRFWTNEFKLKVRTTRKGDRLYTADQVRELKAIHHLVKERGFTLTGAKAKLKAQNKRDVETIDLKTSLRDLRTKLAIMRSQLEPKYEA